MSMRWLSVAAAGSSPAPPRSYERDDMVFDPIHYLPLLEQKIAALDQARAAGRLGTARRALSR